MFQWVTCMGQNFPERGEPTPIFVQAIRVPLGHYLSESASGDQLNGSKKQAFACIFESGDENPVLTISRRIEQHCG